MTTTSQTIIRSPHGNQRPYFCHARATAQDRRLSFEARGLISYILSRPDDWEINVKDIMNEGSIGRDKAYSLIKELKDLRYLQHEQFRQDGQFSGSGYRFYETPQPETPSPASPLTDLPDTANPTQHSTDSTESIEESDSIEQNTDSSAQSRAATNIEKPKRRGSKTSARPPKAPESGEKKPRKRNYRREVIAAYAFDFPPGSKYPDGTGARIGKVLKELDAAFDVPLTHHDLANAFIHNKKGNGGELSQPRDSVKILSMVHTWINAGRPDYERRRQRRAADVNPPRTPPVVPVPTVDYRGYPLQKDQAS